MRSLTTHLHFLDGGGIRGLSELVILQRLMNKLKTQSGSDHVPLPADVFDMIGGTSTGGYVIFNPRYSRRFANAALKASSRYYSDDYAFQSSKL